MIIFGAGASFGSDPGPYPPPAVDRPPLAKDLFEQSYRRFAESYPACRPAIHHLRRALAVESPPLIEEEIGRMYEAAAGNAERQQHLLALRFYLSDLIDTTAQQWWEALNGFTNYGRLLDRIGLWRYEKDQPVALATFNYDQMLDHAATDQALNWQVTGFSSYVDRPDWRLYRLHGSTRWAHVVKTHVVGSQNRPNDVIRSAWSVDFDGQGEMRPVAWPDAVEENEVAVAVPGIAMPTNRKQTFACPPEHVRKFAADIGNVDRLLLIGWRAAEPHALALLEQHVRNGYNLGICDVNAEDAEVVQSNLGAVAKKARPDRLQWFTGGFEALTFGSELNEWLSQDSYDDT
ncbi:MAG: hypothetical protein QOG70_2697 [Solirubrobacteraceae bacterium]|jgi:hypothetical protein|nr:hypothetical protein [Solirubrobacteraceae bacterium]